MSKPENEKQYRLTGARGVPCIANGNSWEESEVKRAVCPNCEQWADSPSGDCFNQCKKRGFVK